ncbi:2Fe-2S iron-sulfur cluster-binding protein [Cupriavidus sp. 30B13]|uniref:2Fe-2S iron-sulfur cluster-binding protein n=1 Tax=Cupriavidus sp. 30B13 TaxID=3384241 RepID=UPI003B917F57
MIEITFLTNDSKVVSAPENSNLLRVSLREKGGIPFKCGGGLCGTCKCKIESGLESTDAIKPKERRHLTDEQFAQGYRMACQTFVNGDISVSWEPQAGPAKPLSIAVRPAAAAAPAAAPQAPAAAPAASTTDAE